jgi:hypothetical protein
MADGNKRQRKEIQEGLGITAGSSQDRQLTTILKQATDKGLEILEKKKGGLYSLKASPVKGLEMITGCIEKKTSNPQKGSPENNPLLKEVMNMPIREGLQAIKVTYDGRHSSQHKAPVRARRLTQHRHR